MKRTHVLSKVLVACVAGVVATSSTVPAVAAEDDADVAIQLVSTTYRADDGAIHYRYDPSDRPGARLETEQGVANTSARGEHYCSFEASGDGTGNTGLVTVVDEVKFDPSTCERTVSVATYPTESLPAAVSSDLGRQKGMIYDSTAEGVSPNTDGASQRGTLASWWQKLSAWVGDPVGIHVTETKISRSWDSGGGWNNNYEWGWYSPSGWYRTSQGQTGNPTTGDTRGTFENYAFGAVNEATHTNHSRTLIVTNSSGWWDWGYTMNKSGEGADVLLSYHYAFG